MSKLQNLRAFVRRQREQGQALVTQIRTDAETVGGAAAAGYLRGRFEDPNEPTKYGVFDIDPELVMAVPLKLVAYTGLLGTASVDAHAVANGVLGFYAGIQALDMGQKHREEDLQGTAGRRRAMGAGSPMRGMPRAAPRAA